MSAEPPIFPDRMISKIKITLFLGVLCMALAAVAFAQGGSMTLLSGLNTVQNKLNATAAPDPTIAVGTLEFCEHVNSGYQCWYKSGPNAFQPVNFLGGTTPKYDSSIWSQNNNNFGNTPNCPLANSPNAQLLHDNVYDVWIMQKRITIASTGVSYMCIAVGNAEDVSQTSPPFTWFAFEFNLDTVIPKNAEGNYYYPDFPQAGLWQTSTSSTPPYVPAKDQAMWITYDLQDINNNNNTIGILVCAVDIAGLRASSSNPWVNNSHTPACVIAHGLSPYTPRDNWVPADNSDTAPPPSSDGEMFTYMIEPTHNGSSYLTSTLHTQGVEQWTINWTATTPAPTFINSWDLPSTQPNGDQLACFDAFNFYNTVCVPQPSTASTGILIDSVGDRMQQPFNYTSNQGLGAVWTSAHAIQIVPNQTVFTQTEADIRTLQWNTANPPAIILANDQTITDPNDPNAYVVLPSIARDKVGNIKGILGVSGSGTNEHPGLESFYYIPSQSSVGSYGYIASPANDGDATDKDPQNYRWGDWYGAVLDPTDLCTIWVVGEYLPVPRTTEPFWYTEIAQLPPSSSCLDSGVVFSNNNVVFGSQTVGVPSPPQNVTLSNNENLALDIINITVTGDFQQSNNCGSSVPANSACTLSITFTPTTTGLRTGTLTVYDNSGTGQQSISLSGTGVLTPVILSPSSVSFGNIAAQSTSAQVPVTFTNAGGTPVSVSSIVASGGFTESDNCAGNVVQPSGTCTINVSFSPALPSVFSGEITVVDNAAASPQLVSLSGTGVAPITFSPTGLNFGNITVGTNSIAKVVTLTNNTSASLSLGDSASGNYAVGPSGRTPCGTTLAASSSCSVGVVFSPTENGTIKGGLTVSYNAAFSPQVLTLTGIGVGGSAGQLTFSVGTLSFQKTALGTTSSSKLVTATNSGSTNLSFTSLVASGNFSASPSGHQPCSGSLLPGASCTFLVNFSPTSIGAISGSVTISDSASNSPQILNLLGTSVPPLSLSPSSLSFGPQTVGTTSPSQIVTLTSFENATITFSAIEASGAYVITTAPTNPCGSSLPALGQCNIGVAFAPNVTGAIQGTVTIIDNALFSPQIVTLSGTGQ